MTDYNSYNTCEYTCTVCTEMLRNFARFTSIKKLRVFLGFEKNRELLRKGDRANPVSRNFEILRKIHAKNTGLYFFATFHLGFDLFLSVKLQQLTYTYIELKSNAAWFALSWYVPVEESEISLELDSVFKAALLKHCIRFEWYVWYNNERKTISYFVMSMI